MGSWKFSTSPTPFLGELLEAELHQKGCVYACIGVCVWSDKEEQDPEPRKRTQHVGEADEIPRWWWKDILGWQLCARGVNWSRLWQVWRLQGDFFTKVNT